PYGGQWVVLTVDEVHRDGRTYRTRERAGMILPRGRLPPSQPSRGSPTANPTDSGPTALPGSAGSTTHPGEVDGGLAVGGRVGVRASVGEARWSDSLGRQPPGA